MSTDALVPYGWDERVATLYASLPAPSASSSSSSERTPARVVRVERSACACMTPSHGERLAVASPLPAVGDWVALRAADDESYVVDHVLERRSALTRQDPGVDNSQQVLAANVDVVVIVAPLDRLRVARIERELLLAWESGARPVVVLTKADLADDAAQAEDDVRRRLVGTEVVLTSSRTGLGVGDVAALLQPNLTAVLFGPSGAGKSTLANALLGDDVLETGEVRAGDRRGRHTTTSRHLLPLPSGGVLIDTPGLRALPLWSGDEGLSATFADVEELAASCRFADCQHEGEPSCAVNAAIDAGELDGDRVSSYRKLLREVAFAERAHDLQARLAEKQRWKAIQKANRDRPPKR
jgi:ribosome biogenesis GTPase